MVGNHSVKEVPLNEAFAEEIEADAYCRDAAVAVETAKKFMKIKQGQL